MSINLLQASAAETIARAGAGLVGARTYASRAAAEAATVPAPVAVISVTVAGGVVSYVRDASGTALTTAGGVTWSPADDVRPESWGAAGDGATDDAAAIQAAIDWVRDVRGGGDVLLRAATYVIGATIRVWEGVTLIGEGGSPRNWWEPAGFTFTLDGTVLRAAAGLNADVVVVELTGAPNADRRHGGGVQRLTIDGNGANNASGNGLVLNGVNVPIVRDVIVGRCAERGVWAKSSGGADSQCNNMHLDRIVSFDNGTVGFALSGGDNQIMGLWGIFNGQTGLTDATGATIYSNCYFNDNGTDGIYSAGEDTDFVGVTAYHNQRNGIVVAGKRPALVGCKARHNGMNTALPATDRCGIVITSAATEWLIDGCSAYDEGYRGDPADLTQQYGFRILSTSPGSWGANIAFGNQTSEFTFSDPTEVTLHTGGTPTMRHPGFVATGGIDFATNFARRIRGLTFDTPLTVSSISDGTLSLSGHSTITLNVSGGATISAIDTLSSGNGLGVVFVRNINTGSVTFTAGSNIRTTSGADLVLAQNRAVAFKEFAAGVWFEL